MKAVVLFGSPRKIGNTRQLVDVFANVVETAQNEVLIFHLNDMNIKPCQGCLSCAESGVCHIDDDMKDVRTSISESDVVVFATPIYWSAPSAQMKIAMDRCLAFLDGQLDSRVKGKKGVVLMSCADNDPSMGTPSLEIFKRTFEGLGFAFAGHVLATGCADEGPVAPEALNDAREVAKSLL
jgi:multimeric flavodoxin WrbA